MKPIKIKISAFGPYKGCVEIDFTNFYDNEIFLITGDTGSGKTTIFDAICFALFGNASGSNRDKNSFRSDFSLDEDKTFVELEFIHKGVVYSVNRSPSYMRKKLRGEGYTLVSGDASISYLDTVISGDKNVSDKCREILGIDYQQFKQISMIAQGEFLKLLFAKSSERSDIFRRIFDTYIYKNISDVLKRKYLDKRREYEDGLINLDVLKDGLLLEEDINLNVNLSDLLELVLSYISRDCDILKEYEFSKKQLMDDLSLLNGKISNVKLINDSFTDYDSSISRLNVLERLENDINIKIEKLKLNKDIYEIIDPIYQELSSLRNNYNENQGILDEKKVLYTSKLDDYNKMACEYKNLDKYRKKLSNLEIKLRDYENKLPLFSSLKELNFKLEESKNIYNLLKLNELDCLLEKFDKNRIILEKLSNEKNNLLKYKRIYDNNCDKYNLLYTKFINCQAGVLASSLEDNNPCPVCGSLVHPKKAKFIDKDVISKDDVDRAFEVLNISQNDVQRISNLVSSLEKDLEVSNKEISLINEEDIRREIDSISGLIINGFVDISKYNIDSIFKDISYIEIEIKNKLSILDFNDNEEELNDNILKLKQEMCSLEKKINDIIIGYDNLLKDKLSMETEIKILKKNISDIKKKILSLNEVYVIEYKKLGYDSEDEYFSVKLDKDEIKQLENEVNNFNNEISLLKEKIHTLKKFIRDNKKEDINKFLLEKDTLDMKISEIELYLKNINNRINSNKKVYDKLKSFSKKNILLEKELSILEDLSNTANGNIKGKNKLEFEQYVQATYFDDVLVSANSRFSYMTDSRYALVRKVSSNRISDKLGLELEVFDNYTGKLRDITTLSGGESFKASLSLALGMSDVIQNYSGGISVEAMFIDEGFGSLDSDSLDQAMNAIMMLSNGNRLIGIISHVDYLKDRIDKKIVVKKSSSGSCVSVVV